jgi:hypothetical protein
MAVRLLQLALVFAAAPSPAGAAWHGPIEGLYGDDPCANLGCDSEKTVEEMETQCRTTSPENHCTGFSGGGVAPGGVLKGGCFRACPPGSLVSAIALAPGGDGRAYYWEDDLADVVAARGGWGLVLPAVLGLGLYVGGGALCNKRAGATGWGMMPHRQHWAHLWALVLDGVAFCKGGGNSHGRCRHFLIYKTQLIIFH